MAEKKIVHEVDIDWLKETYFSDPEKQLVLKKGDVLLRPGEINKRLYLIVKGTLAGYIENESGYQFEIFRSIKDNFVGVYSYFSNAHQSYSTVIAEEDSLLACIDIDQTIIHDKTGRSFANHFLPIIVNEIYMRQLLAQRMSIQNQEALQKLFKAEKMATLGQMAAGLAHELNNAIGVLHHQAEWLAERMSNYMKEKDTHGMHTFFEKGFTEGQKLASSVIRKRKKELENRYGLPIHLARQLAVSGLTDHELAPFASNLRGNVERIYYYFETGLSLHDMLIAAQQAARVVRSVKELGVSNQQMQTLTDVDKTIREALLLLKSLLINVQIRLDLRVSTPVLANPGEMVQIWMNLIKNACEAMTNAATENPELAIRSIEEEGFIKVSIADNGPGIPEDILPKIFQPNVTTKIEGLSFGLGLGLSIVQKLVEIYRGNISVESQVGLTIFRVQLPVSPINV